MNVLVFENELLVGGNVDYLSKIARVVCDYIAMNLIEIFRVSMSGKSLEPSFSRKKEKHLVGLR